MNKLVQLPRCSVFTRTRASCFRPDPYLRPHLMMFATSPVTRSEAVQAERERYVSMSRSDKRALYTCGSRFITLDDVPTWPRYARSNNIAAPAATTTRGGGPTDYTVSAELNDVMSVWRGDITTLEVDAVVNAANSGLRRGGGVCGAIHSAAGPKLQAECNTLGGCQAGSAKLTAGYKLPARYVMHAVGPQGENPQVLSSAYTTCLELCRSHGLRSVAFPCISTGIYGYPNDTAADVALTAMRQWLEVPGNRGCVERIICCLFLDVDVNIYHRLLHHYFPL